MGFQHGKGNFYDRMPSGLLTTSGCGFVLEMLLVTLSMVLTRTLVFLTASSVIWWCHILAETKINILLSIVQQHSFTFSSSMLVI